jgi:5-methylcytosine-specific restriction endonuclease McrA
MYVKGALMPRNVELLYRAAKRHDETMDTRTPRLQSWKYVSIEVGNFDIQKIENPDILGIQYQQGSMFEYQNVRSFLMAREKGKCQLCDKEFSKGNSSHIHHIISRNNGGTDREKNLALIHESCHKKLHKNKSFNLLKKE